MGTGRNGWAIVFVGVVLLLFAVPAAWAQGGSAREQSPLVVGHRALSGSAPTTSRRTWWPPRTAT